MKNLSRFLTKIDEGSDFFSTLNIRVKFQFLIDSCLVCNRKSHRIEEKKIARGLKVLLSVLTTGE